MKKIIKNEYVFSLVAKMVIVVLGVINSIFINRYLEPELKGEYAYVINIVNLFVITLNLGIYQSYPYLKKNSENFKKNTFFNILTIQFVIYFVLFFIIFLFLDVDWIFVFLYLLIPIRIYKEQLMFISMIENINLRNKINIFNQILYSMMLVSVCYYLNADYIYLIILLVLFDIIMIVRIIDKYQFGFKFKDCNLKLFRECIIFGFYPMLTTLLVTINYRIDVIILKWFVGFEQIGLYSVGVGLADKLWLIPDAFKEVLFSKTANKDARKDIVLSIKINIYICIISIIFIVMCGEKLLILLYGIEYILSYQITIIVFIGVIPMIFFKMINTSFIVSGKQKTSFRILFTAAILNIISNMLLIPSMGSVGAAYASVLSYSVCGFLFAKIYAKEVDIQMRDFILFNKDEILLIKNSLKKYLKNCTRRNK